MNCPTCGAPVDFLDEPLMRRGERRMTRSYLYQQPEPVDLAEIKLEGIERFVKLVNLEVRESTDPPGAAFPDAIKTVLDTLQRQVRRPRG